MEVTNSLVEWDEVEDRDILAAFLRTRTGQRLVPKIADYAPILRDSGETNSILIRNGEVLGFQRAIRLLLELATVAPLPTNQTPAGAFPDPEDDDAWADGQKIK